MTIIKADDISHFYVFAGHKIHSLKNISLDIKKGEFVAVIGRNGSGKSTFAKHINMLLSLQSGSLKVCSLDASEIKNKFSIRQHCGMVFQNPDNQFVSDIVREDLEFSLKNHNITVSDDKISKALDMVGLSGFENRRVSTLSGGQKQRLALAGILALESDVLILDEATAMLSPKARDDVLSIITHLHKTTDITIIMITQYAEEAALADKVMVMNNGRISAFGKTDEILSDERLLEGAMLAPPLSVRLYKDLQKNGISLRECPLTYERLVEMICQLQ